MRVYAAVQSAIYAFKICTDKADLKHCDYLKRGQNLDNKKENIGSPYTKPRQYP